MLTCQFSHWKFYILKHHFQTLISFFYILFQVLFFTFYGPFCIFFIKFWLLWRLIFSLSLLPPGSLVITKCETVAISKKYSRKTRDKLKEHLSKNSENLRKPPKTH